ncbi:hypothetical protein thsps21_40550 [Pseudomonas sp. No.21]|nr:hypothetical protein TUM20249_35160 [Pseudomonas tohonis]
MRAWLSSRPRNKILQSRVAFEGPMKIPCHNDPLLDILFSHPEIAAERAPQRPIYSRAERYSFPDPSDPPAVARKHPPEPCIVPFVGPPAP